MKAEWFSAETLYRNLQEKSVDVSTLDLDKAIKYYETGRKLEQKRSKIQASSWLSEKRQNCG